MKFIIGVFFFGITVCCSANGVDSLLRKYHSLKDYGSDSALYDICHEISYQHNDPKEKIKYAEKAFVYASKRGNMDHMAASKFLEANVYTKQGNLDKAINCLFRSRELYDLGNNSIGVATVLSKLGHLYRLNNQYGKSKEAFENSISLFLEHGDIIRLAVTKLNFGELFRELKEFDMAILYYSEANSLSMQVDYSKGIAYSLGNIGLVYAEKSNLDSAELNLRKSIDLLGPLGDNYAVSSFLHGLAQVYYKRKHYSKAKEFAYKSLRLAKEHGLKEQMRDASLKLSAIYNQSGDFEKAFYHHKQYVAYRDSINNEETIRKIANLNTKYEVAQKQKEVDIEKAKKEQYFFAAIFAVIAGSLLLILVFIVLKISRERKKINKKLTQQHKQLEAANATKNKYFSILSHDLRSPLSTFHSYTEVIDMCVKNKEFDYIGELSGEIRSSSANLIDLMDNLLQWGVDQMEAATSIAKTVSLKDVVQTEVMHLQHVSDKKSIIINMQVHHDLTLFVDEIRLSIAIRNLINNAIKFTPIGGKVVVSSFLQEKKTILKIADTGVGMTQEQKHKFLKFGKIVSSYGTQNEKGVGLGLQLVCEFVKSCGASIEIDTELGKGTCFTIEFENNKCTAK